MITDPVHSNFSMNKNCNNPTVYENAFPVFSLITHEGINIQSFGVMMVQGINKKLLVIYHAEFSLGKGKNSWCCINTYQILFDLMNFHLTNFS